MVIMKQKDIRPAPSLIEYKNMRFLITDRPSDVTIQGYLQVSNTNYSLLQIIHDLLSHRVCHSVITNSSTIAIYQI